MGLSRNDENETERLKQLLGELAAIDGVAGHEQAVVARLKELFEPLADEFQIDSYGNLFATLNGPSGSPTLMISAHSDEIGAIVKSIEPNGMIRFERLGGIVETLTIGRHIRIRGHRGVVGVKAGHIQTPEERGRAPGMRELYIDMGSKRRMRFVRSASESAMPSPTMSRWSSSPTAIAWRAKRSTTESAAPFWCISRSVFATPRLAAPCTWS